MTHIRYKRKGIVLSTILETTIILILTSSTACQTPSKQAPLSMESVITPVDVYESIEDKNLITTYQNNLKNIYKNVRARYKPSQLEFFLISGISFRKMQVDTSYDTYLSLNTKSSKLFLDSKTSFEQRVSIIFNKDIKPLLKISAEEREILQDNNIAGIMINTRWKVKKILKEKYPITLFEQVSLITQKEQIDKYLRETITDQELLDQSTLIAISEGESPQIIKLHLE
ncbi:MAG: hypothetical protein AMJ42_02135 [Deltaproteobacteria bacterium DG_8]|nr:MAG: hypothetical protein AMJ42_02135 [Deltaproteobacteria bacterium DG_8]